MPNENDELKRRLQSLVSEILTQAAVPLVDKMVDTIRDTVRRHAQAKVEAEREEMRARRAAEGGDVGAPPGARAAKPPPTPYTVLRVVPGAPLEVCEAAWKALSRITHPDGVTDPREKRRREERQKALNLAIDAIRRERAAGRGGDGTGA